MIYNQYDITSVISHAGRYKREVHNTVGTVPVMRYIIILWLIRRVGKLKMDTFEHFSNDEQLSSFPQFSAFPPEIRSLVWMYTFPPATVIAEWTEIRGVTLRRLEPTESTWVMLSCWEARDMARGASSRRI